MINTSTGSIALITSLKESIKLLELLQDSVITFLFGSWRAIGIVRMLGVNNGKFVIDFRSSEVRQAFSCIHYFFIIIFTKADDVHGYGTRSATRGNYYVK